MSSNQTGLYNDFLFQREGREEGEKDGGSNSHPGKGNK